MLIVGAFATLFLIGWILADARLRTKALWLSIGLHAGWIFGNGIFNRLAHRRILALPWLGRNLLIGLVPLGVCLLTWGLVVLFLRPRSSRNTNMLGALVSLFYPPICAECSANVPAGEYLCDECDGSVLRIELALLPNMFRAFFRRHLRPVYMRELRRSRSPF